MNWNPICHITDVDDNAGVCAKINDLQVALFKFIIGGEPQYFATGNWDPIGEANVLSRGILGSIGEELVVASPLYKQHFSLTTGQCLEDESASIPVYPVRVVDEKLEVQA
jgi:nitrite reductase (NADH) small subunit